MICDAVFQLIFSHLKQIDEFERKIAIFVLNAFINAMFGCPMKNIKENQIYLKLIKNFIFKLFNLYNDELK